MSAINTLSKPKYETFEAVYTSGLLIEPSLLTALCLIFDKIHILNNLEFAIEFSRKYVFMSINDKLARSADTIEISPLHKDDQSDPLSILNEQQQFTARYYLTNVISLWAPYDALFRHGVISSSIFENSEPIKVELIKKGKPGQLNKYRVSLGSLTLTMDALAELDQMVEDGKVPILGYPHVQFKNAKTQSERFTASQLASMLALRSLNLVLPQTKPVDADIILEARERLRDYLLPFWSSMLSLAGSCKSLMHQNTSIPDIERECQFIIDTHVRPNLIDLNRQLTKEPKGWYRKIVTPFMSGVKIFAAKPPLTTADLLTTGVAAGANITLDIIAQSMKLRPSTKQSGLTLLIELDKYLRNRKTG